MRQATSATSAATLWQAEADGASIEEEKNSKERVSVEKKRSSQAAADQDVEKVKKRLVGSSCETVSSHLIVSPSARRKIIFLTFFLIFSLSLNLLSCLFQFRFSSSRLFSRAILFASQLSLSSFLFLPSLSFCYLLAYSVSVLTKPLYYLRLLFHLSNSLPLCLSPSCLHSLSPSSFSPYFWRKTTKINCFRKCPSTETCCCKESSMAKENYLSAGL